MTQLVFPADCYARLSATLVKSEVESCAIVLANSVKAPRGNRLLITEMIVAPPEAYSYRTEYSAELKPDFLIPLAKRARASRQSIIFCHTHPNAKGVPYFSAKDDEGENALASFLANRVPDVLHAALVIGRDGCRARILGSTEEIEVYEIGTHRKVLFSNILSSSYRKDSFDRQIRAFGSQGQAEVERLVIGIVGLGGTGSIVANELSHLGCKHFVLIDPDDVEQTNLNRLVGAGSDDTGKAKVDIAERAIQNIRPEAKIFKRKADVTVRGVAQHLFDCDFIFCCTDSHSSRAVLNQLAYQYYIPCIDMGVSITTNEGAVTHITGRIQLLSPGMGCLTCGNLLDGNTIRQEMLSVEQRLADPYFQGEGEPQPAVMSLNGTVASLAVTMFLGTVTPIPVTARLQFYDGMRGVVRSALQNKDPTCIVCSENGASGLGHGWSLPVKGSDQ